MTDRSFVDANAEAAAALRTLVESLSPADLENDLGGGWTVSMALAHLAFWDRWHLARWRHAALVGAVAPPAVSEEVSDRANDALEPLWSAIPAERAVVLALDAAADVDALVASLPDAAVDAARAADGARWVDRSPHRWDHIAQVRDALARG